MKKLQLKIWPNGIRKASIAEDTYESDPDHLDERDDFTVPNTLGGETIETTRELFQRRCRLVHKRRTDLCDISVIESIDTADRMMTELSLTKKIAGEFSNAFADLSAFGQCHAQIERTKALSNGNEDKAQSAYMDKVEDSVSSDLAELTFVNKTIHTGASTNSMEVSTISGCSNDATTLSDSVEATTLSGIEDSTEWSEDTSHVDSLGYPRIEPARKPMLHRLRGMARLPILKNVREERPKGVQQRQSPPSCPIESCETLPSSNYMPLTSGEQSQKCKPVVDSTSTADGSSVEVRKGSIFLKHLHSKSSQSVVGSTSSYSRFVESHQASSVSHSDKARKESVTNSAAPATAQQVVLSADSVDQIEMEQMQLSSNADIAPKDSAYCGYEMRSAKDPERYSSQEESHKDRSIHIAVLATNFNEAMRKKSPRTVSESVSTIGWSKSRDWLRRLGKGENTRPEDERIVDGNDSLIEVKSHEQDDAEEEVILFGDPSKDADLSDHATIFDSASYINWTEDLNLFAALADLNIENSEEDGALDTDTQTLSSVKEAKRASRRKRQARPFNFARQAIKKIKRTTSIDPDDDPVKIVDAVEQKPLGVPVRSLESTDRKCLETQWSHASNMATTTTTLGHLTAAFDAPKLASSDGKKEKRGGVNCGLNTVEVEHIDGNETNGTLLHINAQTRKEGSNSSPGLFDKWRIRSYVHSTAVEKRVDTTTIRGEALLDADFVDWIRRTTLSDDSKSNKDSFDDLKLVDYSATKLIKGKAFMGSTKRDNGPIVESLLLESLSHSALEMGLVNEAQEPK